LLLNVIPIGTSTAQTLVVAATAGAAVKLFGAGSRLAEPMRCASSSAAITFAISPEQS
jgi:hypothetical protein